MFENTMRRKGDVPGEWRKLHKEELHNLYYYPPKGRYMLSVKLSDFTVTSYLTEKLSKLRSFDR